MTELGPAGDPFLRGAAEAEDHAGQDGKGAEEPERGDGAGAGQGDGGQ